LINTVQKIISTITPATDVYIMEGLSACGRIDHPDRGGIVRRAVIFVSIAVLLITTPLMASWEEAMAAFERGEYEVAAKVFATYVKTKTRNPAYANAYHMLGRCQIELDQPAEGLVNLRTALELKPDNVGYRLALGQTLINERDYAEATAVFDALDLIQVAASQRTAVALAHGNAALRAGNAARAIAIAEARLSDDPGSAALHKLAGMAAVEAGEDAVAFDHLTMTFELDHNATSAGAAAVRCALRLMESSEDDGTRDAWLAKAATAGERLAKYSQEDQHLRLAGRVAYSAGRFEQAAAWLGLACETTPDDPELSYLYGRSLAELERDDEAATALNAALKADPEPELERRIHRQLARVYARDLDLEAAEQHFRLAGETERAVSIHEIAAGFEEALDRRRQLARQLTELRMMTEQLEALNDAEGVRALRQQMTVAQKELDGLDANLGEVRAALREL